MRLFRLFAVLLACDPGTCPEPGTTSLTGGQYVQTGDTLDPTDSGGAMPVAPPPDKLCGQFGTTPKVICGLVCVDDLGISEVIVCQEYGAWECRLYPRTGPIIGEVYDDLPVWCGGDGKAQGETRETG